MKKLNAVVLFSGVLFFAGTIGVMAQVAEEKMEIIETETEVEVIKKADPDALEIQEATKVEIKTKLEYDLETRAKIKGEGQPKKEDVEELEDDDDDGDDGDD